MSKNFLFKALLGLVFGFLVSCDNTTDDPINQNKTTNTNNNGGMPTITGPRILHKVMSGTVTAEEYVTNAGTLSQVILKDVGSTNTTTATLTYTSGKITGIKYQDNANPHIIDNDYTISYNGSGKLSTFTMQQAVFATTNKTDFAVTFDTAGNVKKMTEKKKMGGSAVYTHYGEYVFTFSGNNVSKVDYTTMLMDNNVPDQTTALTTSYMYDNYDSKINPYTTLPKDYFIITSTIFQVNFNFISENNVGKVTMQNGLGGFSYPKGYLYDSQNYPTSDQGQIVKYIYKAL